MKPITTDQMLADLSASFPQLWKRRLCDFSEHFAGEQGVWTGCDTEHTICGEPMFVRIYDGTEPPYESGYVHSALVAWLSARGWTWDHWDNTTYFLVPDPDLMEQAAPNANSINDLVAEQATEQAAPK